MSYTDLIDESFSYNSIIRLYRFFLFSVFFSILKRSVRYAYMVSKKIVLNSKTLRLSMSLYRPCAAYVRRLIMIEKVEKAFSFLVSIYLNSLTYKLLNAKI